jgi:hypothetical protein
MGQAQDHQKNSANSIKIAMSLPKQVSCSRSKAIANRPAHYS